MRAEKYAEKYYRGKQGLDCYLKLMQATGYSMRWNIPDNNLARQMMEEAGVLYIIASGKAEFDLAYGFAANGYWTAAEAAQLSGITILFCIQKSTGY